MTLAYFSLINGLSLGLEYVSAMPEEGIGNSVVLDFFIFRFIFSVK